jgi:hypothetical protein
MGILDFLKGKSKASDIETLLAEQRDLQGAFERAQINFQGSKRLYKQKKDALCEFNNKYGRVLQLINED